MAPIKRHKALQPLSREHHHTLLLVWKIRKGLSKHIEPERMKKYADWYLTHHLLPHFEKEEQDFAGILPEQDAGLQQMKEEHAVIKTAFAKETNEETLTTIANLLEKHVRFEERDLFNRVQEIATEEQLQEFYPEEEEEKFEDNEADVFWT